MSMRLIHEINCEIFKKSQLHDIDREVKLNMIKKVLVEFDIPTSGHIIYKFDVFDQYMNKTDDNHEEHYLIDRCRDNNVVIYRLHFKIKDDT